MSSDFDPLPIPSATLSQVRCDGYKKSKTKIQGAYERQEKEVPFGVWNESKTFNVLDPRRKTLWYWGLRTTKKKRSDVCEPWRKTL